MAQESDRLKPARRGPAATGIACSACGASASVGERYCGQCGATLSLRCPACAADNPPDHLFCGECGARLAAESHAPSRPRSGVAEERRWASIVFVDLSGFTAVAEQLDPEDVKELAQACVAQFSATVARFGGSVIRELGDEVLAVFGAPVAHEDDAERAVRAALAMRNAAPIDAAGAQLRVHIGINTGEVMAGVVGGAERRDYTVHGDTVNTAARLRSAAAPATVLVGDETYRATRRVVRYRRAAAVQAKGKERAVVAWEALEVAPVPEARPLGTAPLIGRDHELALLREVWLKVRREGQPHLVTVLGEPGIGKSRLVAEFERRGLADATVLHGRCLPYGEVLGYWALATALKEATGVSAEDDASQARARLEALVVGALEAEGQADEAAEIARHLALLSGLDLEGDRSSAVDQRVLHSSARRFLEGLARQHPTCLLLEDIHWADHALLDLVEFVAARAVDAPLLIVGQARPELLEKRPTWGRGVRASASLHLEPLGAGDVSELARVLCQRHGLEDRLVEQIARGAGGNPLFAEELAAMLGERGASSEGTPALLKSLISARLDLLPRGEREAVQLAAVCGRVFWESALRALGASGDIAVHLEALEHKALLRAQVPSQFRGDKQYAFKHDLIRDVAYEILPRVVRRLLHARVADWIEQASGQRVEGYLDLLAHHAVQAEQPERALGYLRRAAERAGHAAAHRQEAALLGEAVSLAQRLGTGDLVPVLLAERGRAFASCGLWVEARVPMEAALAVLPPEHVEERARVLIDLSEVCFWAMDVARLHQCASEANVLAARLARDDLAAEATAWLAESAKVDGDLPVAADLYRRAIAQAGGVRSRPLAHAPLTLYLLGQVDEAVEVGRQAAEMVRGVIRGAGDTLATMYALPHLGLALAANGQYAEALAVEARDLARSTSFPLTVVSAGIDLLLNFARRQEVGRAEELVGEVAEAAAQVGGWHGWLWQIRLAEARAEIALARGDGDEALRWSSTAIEASRAKSRPKYHVLGLGTRAQALGRLGRERRAIADLRGAMELARGVNDPALVLRTASLLLAVDGDDELLAEATAAARRIASGLPDMLRTPFAAAEPVRQLAGFALRES